jgi:GAF domain-containing protein
MDDLLAGIRIALVIAMFVLLWRLVNRMLRVVNASNRHHAGISQSLLDAVERFADQPAGFDGSADALGDVACSLGCEALLWNAEDRVLERAHDGMRTCLTPGIAHRFVDGMRARRTLAIPDIRVTSLLPGDMCAHDEMMAMLIAPMWSSQGLVGIVLKRYSHAAALQAADDSNLVSGIAALGAVAIDKALTVDREKQRAQDNALLLRSVELSGEGSASIRECLASYSQQAVEALDARRCAIYGIMGGQFRVVGSCGIPGTITSSALRISTRSAFTTLLAQHRHGPRVISQESFDEPAQNALAQLGFRSDVVMHPVVQGDSIIGALAIDCDSDRLGDREGALLAALSRQVALALERQRMSRSMSKRSRHLACTPKLTRSLTGQRDPEAVARIAARELSDGFGFERVSIALVQPNAESRVVASAGMLAQSSAPVISTRAIDAVCRSGLPYIACIGEHQPPHVGDLNAPFGARSQIVVPIAGSEDQDGCIGAIAVYERDPENLGEDDLHMLETVADQLAATIEQAQLFARLERTYFRTVEALAAALEAKDAYTLDHARSITETAAAVGRRLGMRDTSIRDLKLGALLHDIGKIGVPTHILNKPGPLDDEEQIVMQQHTVIGEQIIAPIEFLDGVRPLVLHEHERWDGKGYPMGLRGNDIPLGARIIFVCDAFHAMTSDRPYRKALPVSEAKRRLRSGANRQFDPEVVDAFLQVMETPEVLGEPELALV